MERFLIHKPVTFPAGSQSVWNESKLVISIVIDPLPATQAVKESMVVVWRLDWIVTYNNNYYYYLEETLCYTVRDTGYFHQWHENTEEVLLNNRNNQQSCREMLNCDIVLYVIFTLSTLLNGLKQSPFI